MTFDLDKVRADFPILSEVIHGNRLVYLDSGASAQKPVQVLDRMDHAFRHEYANVHRGLHTLANRATEAYEGGRHAVQTFLNAARPEEIIFTRSATEAINLVAQSFAGPRIGEGDEIVLSIMEHHSNIVPWHFHRERKGAVIKWVDVRDDGSFDLDAFAAALTDRTRIVAVTHMSNVLGTVTPIKEVIEIAHARGIPVLIDGSQGAVHTRVDVQDLDADFYVFSGHKMFGPTGSGIVYGKRKWLDAMPPYQTGGSQIRTVSFEKTTYAPLPAKFEAGTPAIAAGIGLGAAIDYLNAIDFAAAAKYEHELLEYATQRLSDIPGVTIVGTAAEKASVLSFTIEGIHPHDIGTILDQDGIAVRAGHHCAQPVMKHFEVPATARASFAFYNTREEVDKLVDSVQKVIEVFA